MNIDYDLVSVRCYNMVDKSTSLPMLECAYNYYRLFYNLLVRRHVNIDIMNRIDRTILKAYKRKAHQL